MQGFGVTDRVQAQRAKERDRAAARARRAARQPEDPAEQAPQRGMLRKLFRI